MAEIILNNGMRVLVDEEDYEDLAKYRWCLDGRGYACRTEPTGLARPKKRPVKMHRQILGLKWGDGVLVDHINGNRLDNRKQNLRPCNKAQNGRNRGPQKNNSVGLKGVSWHKRDQTYYARIKINGKTTHLGSFPTAEEAHAAYCSAADQLHGQFANYGIHTLAHPPTGGGNADR